jgi:hypothetical protein
MNYVTCRQRRLRTLVTRVSVGVAEDDVTVTSLFATQHRRRDLTRVRHHIPEPDRPRAGGETNWRKQGAGVLTFRAP